MRRVVFVLVVLLTAVAIISSGCGQKQVTIEKGRLLVGGDTNIPPMISMEGGKPVGYSVDLCDEIATRMGLKSKIVPAVFKNLINDLNSDEFDIIGQPIAINPERKAEIDQSIPYFDLHQAIFIVKSSPIKTEADLAGKVVGAKAGTSAEMTVEGLDGVKQVKPFDTHELGFEALIKGEIDAYVGYVESTSVISEKTGKTIMVTEIGTAEPCGIGVKKGNSELLEQVDKALEDMKKDGTLDKLEKKWFGPE